MKKIFFKMITISAIFIFILLYIFTLTNNFAIYKSVVTAKNSTVIRLDDYSVDIHDTLTSFLNISADRTPGSDGEQLSADYLQDQLQNMGFVVRQQVVNGNAQSQNIIGRLEFSTDLTRDKKVVVIGAQYSNIYEDLSNASIDGYTGALQNGTAVATVLEVARQLASNNIDITEYDIEVVFFGGDKYEGAVAYVDNFEYIDNIVAMYNVARLAGDNMYLYTDEVTRSHRELIVKYDTLGLKDMPSSRVILPQLVYGLPYSHYGLTDSHAVFYEKGIPVSHIFGGNLATVKLEDVESANRSNLGNTSSDNIYNLLDIYPQVLDNMTKVASTIYNSLIDSGFLDIMTISKTESFKFASFANTDVADYLGFIIVASIAIVFVVYLNLSSKKLKQQPKITKRADLPVFGVDYETKKDDNKNDSDPFDSE